MNKKIFLSCLSLVILVVTSAYVPVAAAAKISTPMISQASPPGQGLRRIVGVVSAYTAGQSITIVDRHGTQFVFDLASPLRILPAHRANLLGVGAFVTVISPNNMPNGKHIAVGIVIHRGVPNGFAGPSGPNVPPPTPTPTPPNIPTNPVPPESQPDIDTFATNRPLSPIIGFTFPAGIDVGGVVPLEAAAFLDFQPPASDGFSEVGMVAVSLDQFIVAIDVVSMSDIVAGQLISTTGPDVVDVNFRRIPQIVNPDRANATYAEFQLDSAPDTTAAITPNSVCFVVSTAADTFTRYCSTSATLLSQPLERQTRLWATNSASANRSSSVQSVDPVANALLLLPPQIVSPASLSVQDSFPTQYTDLQNMIVAAAAHIGFQAPLALDLTLSTIQDAQRIQDCASAVGECTSDIVAAPVPLDYFEQQYNEKFGGDNGDDDDEEESATAASSSPPTPIALGVVSVLQPIEYSTGIVQPGDYRLDAWFDTNGVFFAATLTGLTTNDSPVVNQQIPAIPATFIDAVGNGPGVEIDRFCIWHFCCGR
jgi:hypothetical protein